MKFYDHNIPLRVIYGGFVANLSLVSLAFAAFFNWEVFSLVYILWATLSVAGLVTSVLFMIGVTWSRILLSTLLHLAFSGFVIAFLVMWLISTRFDDKLALGGIFVFGAVQCILAILLLNERAIKNEFQHQPKSNPNMTRDQITDTRGAADSSA